MYLQSVTVHGYKAASARPLQCILPGRFALLAGPNSSGKSTVVESILMAHRDVFPPVGRPTSAALSASVVAPTIDVEYSLESPDGSPLGELYETSGAGPRWTTALSSSMGRISASRIDSIAEGRFPILYLSPVRNPATDLAGRDARLIVELLRAQVLRERGDKSLKSLARQLSGLIGSVVSKAPVAGAEERVASALAALTEGVSGRVPFLATTAIDDTFLARVFEFLLAGLAADRIDARRLEVEGLGYANMLQLAVVLAAIPDLTSGPVHSGGHGSASDSGDHAGSEVDASSTDARTALDDDRSDAERVALMEEAAEQRRLDEDAFFAGSFHAVVVLEEPEAHLHPQLQHGLVRYLKEVVSERPEVQVVMTTHSDEIVSACDPEDLVLFRRGDDDQPVIRTVRLFGLSSKNIAQARRHLDVNRSAALFADRLVLVEGVTDAIVLRAVARAWADSDQVRRRFVDALTITVVGSRIGSWLPKLLTRPGMEVSTRLAVLRDSDDEPVPRWVTARRSECFGVFLNEPTLEPALVEGNESLIDEVFGRMKVRKLPWAKEDGPTSDAVEAWFAGKGKGRKAEFADLFSVVVTEDPSLVTIPEHMGRLLDFVWEDFLPQEVAERTASTAGSAQPEDPKDSKNLDAHRDD